MPATGAVNTWPFNVLPFNGARSRSAVLVIPVPLRLLCLTAEFGWELDLPTTRMGCAMPKKYDVPTTAAIIRATDVKVSLPLTNLPTGRTISSATLYIKQRQSDADGSAAVAKTITASAASSGQITDVGTDDTAAMNFLLSDTETELLTSSKYHYFVRTTCSDGIISVPIRGSLPVESA